MYPIQFIRDLCRFAGYSKDFNNMIEQLSLRVKLFDCNGDVIPVDMIEEVCISAENISFKALVNGEWRDVYYKLDEGLHPFREKAVRDITIEHCEGMQRNLDALAMQGGAETPLHLVNHVLGVKINFRYKTDYDYHRKKVMNAIKSGGVKLPSTFDADFFNNLIQQVLDINGKEITLLPRKFNHI